MQISGPVSPIVSKGTTHAAASPQLVKAANAFEANFLKELLKPLREDPLFGNGSGLGGDSLGSDGSSGGSMATVSSLASDALAQAIAKQGGLGIAKMVLAQLAPVEQGASQANPAATGSTGLECGDCARTLTIGTESAGFLRGGAMEMLEEENASPASGVSTTNTAVRVTRGAISGQHRHAFELAPVVRPAGRARK